MPRSTAPSLQPLHAAYFALCATLLATACSTPDTALAPATPALSVGNPLNTGAANPFTLAVIGDMPYGPAKRDSIPMLIDLINSDPKVDVVVHLGDIKAGSKTSVHGRVLRRHPLAVRHVQGSPRLHAGRQRVDRLPRRRSRTTACTRRPSGCQAVRALFFPVPGQTLGGRKMQVLTQADDPANSAYVENVMFIQSRVVFATANITGSNNDLAPWGSPLPADAANYPSQAAEYAARAQANAAWIDKAFDLAASTDAAGVVLAFQADMWDPAEPTLSGFDALVQQIGTRAAAFGKPVLLLEGDSHAFEVQYPYSANSPMRLVHPNTPVAENVTRIVVEGSAGGPSTCGSPWIRRRRTARCSPGSGCRWLRNHAALGLSAWFAGGSA